MYSHAAERPLWKSSKAAEQHRWHEKAHATILMSVLCFFYFPAYNYRFYFLHVFLQIYYWKISFAHAREPENLIMFHYLTMLVAMLYIVLLRCLHR